MGPYPYESLRRLDHVDLDAVPVFEKLDFQKSDAPSSIINAMGEYQAMMDAIRDGLINKTKARIPSDPKERAEHLKAFGYFSDATQVAICALPDKAA